MIVKDWKVRGERHRFLGIDMHHPRRKIDQPFMTDLKKGILFISLISAACVFMVPQQVRASHAAGGEIIYEWVSGNTYRFYFKFYRDCGGIDESSTIRLCYFNSCGSGSGTASLRLMTVLPDGSPNMREVQPGCANYPTECSGGYLPGFREYWYEATVTLPTQCDYWTFYTSVVTRNTNNNINAGNLYVEATLNNLDAPQQSSPWFSTKPVPYVCINNPYTFNNGTVDPDGDSLSFEFINPRQITGSNCAATYTAQNLTFRTGYSLAEPFATGNTFSFSTTTGQMSFTPTQVSANTIAMRVNKWRGGKKIGSVMRDIQIQVMNCNVPPPAMNLVAGSFSGSAFVNGRVEGNANQPMSFCFDVISPSADAVLKVTDNHDVIAPGSVTYYNGVGTNQVIGCFNWTPSCADTGLKIFTITVKDSTCKPPGISITQSFSIPLYIRAGSETVTRKIACAGEAVQLQSSGKTPTTWSVLPGGSPENSLSCIQCSNPVARPQLTTTYEGVSASNGCVHVDRVTVEVDNEPGRIAITPASPHVLCDPDTVHLGVDITGPLPLVNLACGPAAQIPSTPADSVEVTPGKAAVQNVPNISSTPFSGSANTSARHQYLLRASDMRASGMMPGTLTSVSFRISSISPGAIYEDISIALGCTDRDVMDATAGFLPTTPVYTATAPLRVLTMGGWMTFVFDTPYNWDTTQNLVVDICYTNSGSTAPAYTYFFNTNYQTTLYSYVTSGSVCGSAGMQVFSTHELPQIRLGYHLAPDAPGFEVKWAGGVFMPSDTIRNPSVFVQDVVNLSVHSESRYGCALVDTLNVYFADPFSVTEDTSICFGSAVQLLAEEGSSFQWYENGFNPPTTLSCDQCADPIATPKEDIVYTVVGRNIYDCLDTLHVRVRVRPLPQVQILNSDTTIIYGESMELAVTGADRYAWMPVTGLSDPGGNVTVATPLEPTVYVVAGVTDGCFGYDTIRIDVDMRSRAFIPSAFSPNGDGKNDVFRVGNLSFEKVQEFRVFSRWGEEVFHAEYGNNGWDGTWKGEPQPAGVYQYMIRLAYPDGTMKLFKGTITLVR
jgi:gliding motility-associated-like protein